jgi:type VI secretion system protein VasJ
LTFKDGTPFARPVTVDWIEDEVRPRLREGDDPGEAGGREALPVEADHAEARKALGGGDLDAALDTLRDGRSQDVSGREAFRRRLYAATLCLKGEAPRVAQPLLDELATDVQTHTLDTWAPSLAVEVWAHRCRCYDVLAQAALEEDAATLRAKADASFEKVCQINPSRAVAIERQRTS